MDERRQLLAAIEDFCAREGMAPTAFGRKAMGDGRRVAPLGEQLAPEGRDRRQRIVVHLAAGQLGHPFVEQLHE